MFQRLTMMALCHLWTSGCAQVLRDGRVSSSCWPDARETIPLPNVLCIASARGSAHESSAFRTWEREPRGWFRVSGAAGDYTLLFTAPAHFLRPAVLNNVFARADEKILGMRGEPQFGFHSSWETEWETQPPTDYFQTLVARGKNVTSVGFKLARDGIDGAGPGKQDLPASYARSFEHPAEVGYDPTGQDHDSRAPTIVRTAHPKLHGVWERFRSPPIRPATNAISVWLRARSPGTEFPFKADFDGLARFHRPA